MFYTQSYKKISLYKIVPLYKIEIIWLLYFFTIICQYQYGTHLFFFSKEKNEVIKEYIIFSFLTTESNSIV